MPDRLTVVVLGGSGFIGAAVCTALRDDGHRVISVSRHGSAPLPTGVRRVEASYDNYTALAPFLAEADCIIHAAWDTTPGASAGQAALEVGENLVPLARLLDQLAPVYSGRFIFISTGGALHGAGRAPQAEDPTARGHGNAAGRALTEDTPGTPASYYGASKGAAELFLNAFAAQSASSVVALRPSNVYGPGQLSRRTFAVVPTLLNALKHGHPFTMRGDGMAARDYLFIEDFVSLLRQCVVDANVHSRMQTFNACSGRLVTLRELVLLAEGITGRQAQVIHEPIGATDVFTTPLSCARAHAHYGWHAATSLEEGLEQTWQWIQTVT